MAHHVRATWPGSEQGPYRFERHVGEPVHLASSLTLKRQADRIACAAVRAVAAGQPVSLELSAVGERRDEPGLGLLDLAELGVPLHHYSKLSQPITEYVLQSARRPKRGSKTGQGARCF